MALAACGAIAVFTAVALTPKGTDTNPGSGTDRVVDQADADIHANSDGCTGAPSGIVCAKVYGSGLHVDRVQAVRDKLKEPATICNYSAEVDIWKPGQGVDSRQSGVVRNGSCSMNRAFVDFHINADLPDRTKICVTFYESGAQQGGKPCVDVHP